MMGPYPTFQGTLEESLFIGIDVGTSGVRACVVDTTLSPRAVAERPLPQPQQDAASSTQDPELWWQKLYAVLTEVAILCPPGAIKRLAVASTSATLLLVDLRGRPLGPALMYNDQQSRAEAQRISEIAPATSGAHGASSSLAKLAYLHRHGETDRAYRALHAADWLAGRLTGRFGISDENNALKLGYDPFMRAWPKWLETLVPPRLLPEVVPPGTPVGPIRPPLQATFGLAMDAQVIAGTTDSIAAFLATGAEKPGEAVTSLGSTLALKVLSERPVFAPEYGVYSHRLGSRWLAGGASNSGGAVLRQYFSPEELTALTPHLKPDQPTGLDYYPLPRTGERFPEADPDRQPRLTPQPADRVRFFQGLLEALARIEQRGYQRLAELGAPYPGSVRSVGGGAANPAWTGIRKQLLGVPVLTPAQQGAAYGVARLAALEYRHASLSEGNH